jgi:hypothetical protein
LKTLAFRRSFAILLLILVALLVISRCSQAEKKTQPNQALTALSTPVQVEPSISAEPEELAPAVAESDSPKAKPKAKLPIAETKKVTPPTRKSAKPTPTISDEPVFGEPVVEGDFNGDGDPDTILPTVTFGKLSCVELGDRFVFQVEVNLSGGDNYRIPAKVRNGWEMKVSRGKMWFNQPETIYLRIGELRLPVYKIKSVKERSWTFFEAIGIQFSNRFRNLTVPLSDDMKYGGKLLLEPFEILADNPHRWVEFPYPDDFNFSLCKK